MQSDDTSGSIDGRQLRRFFRIQIIEHNYGISKIDVANFLDGTIPVM